MVRTKYSTLKVSELLEEPDIQEVRDSSEAGAELYARLDDLLKNAFDSSMDHLPVNQLIS